VAGLNGGNRVIRGGSWNENARNDRAANRNGNDPGNSNDNLGFRLFRARVRVGWPAGDPVGLAIACLSCDESKAAPVCE
jgi:hypothetical protein